MGKGLTFGQSHIQHNQGEMRNMIKIKTGKLSNDSNAIVYANESSFLEADWGKLARIKGSENKLKEELKIQKDNRKKETK